MHAGVAYDNKHYTPNRIYKYDRQWTPVFGINGIAGLEYVFPDVPFLVAVNLKPYFEFTTTRIFQLDVLDVAFAVKYRF